MQCQKPSCEKRHQLAVVGQIHERPVIQDTSFGSSCKRSKRRRWNTKKPPLMRLWGATGLLVENSTTWHAVELQFAEAARVGAPP